MDAEARAVFTALVKVLREATAEAHIALSSGERHRVVPGRKRLETTPRLPRAVSAQMGAVSTQAEQRRPEEKPGDEREDQGCGPGEGWGVSVRTQPQSPAREDAARRRGGTRGAAAGGPPPGRPTATHQELQHLLSVGIDLDDLLVQGRDLEGSRTAPDVSPPPRFSLTSPTFSNKKRGGACKGDGGSHRGSSRLRDHRPRESVLLALHALTSILLAPRKPHTPLTQEFSG